MTTKFLTIILALLILLFVLELSRREKLTFKYAFGWLIVSFLAVALTVFDKFLFQTAKFFGFELTSNFIFFTLLSVFVFLSLMLTVFLCEEDKRNQKIAQKLGTLEFKISQLSKKSEKK